MSETSKMNDQSNRSGEFWDPLEDSVYVIEDKKLNKEVKAFLPESVAKQSIWLLPIGLIAMINGIFTNDNTEQSISYFIFFSSICVMLLIDNFTGSHEKNLKQLKEMADHLNFAFRAEMPDNRKSWLKRRVGEFFRLRVGSAIPLVVEREMWGFCQDGKVPLWIGLELMRSSGASSKLKAQTMGKDAGRHGKMLMFIVAYELNRDTGVRVQLFPEFKTPLGPLDIDIQTESVEFNEKFNIRLSCQENQKNIVKEMSAELLQVLTPAFQTSLIDLADKYAVRIIIDGTSVFFAGYHNMVSNDQNELAEMLNKLVGDLAVAALSFKRFAE